MKEIRQVRDQSNFDDNALQEQIDKLNKNLKMSSESFNSRLDDVSTQLRQIEEEESNNYNELKEFLDKSEHKFMCDLQDLKSEIFEHTDKQTKEVFEQSYR